MEAYLDNAATTRVDPEAAALMEKIFLEDFGNPSSLHKMGFNAEQYVNQALDVFSSAIKCKKKNLIFTSGGTESNNTAIIGTALFKERRGKHIITTAIEHAAVSEPFRFLESRGWEADFLSVDERGIIDLDELKSKLRKDTVLVSVMHVNNETGSIQPVSEVGRIIKETVPECFFHVDDIQGFGKIKLDIPASNIDLLSVSSHKIHGPKGAGLLYLSDRALHISPIVFGGGQQGGLRSGTLNTPGIAGFAKAFEGVFGSIDENYKRIRDHKEYFLEGLSSISDVRVNGAEGDSASPYILSLTVKGVRSEVLLHALEEKGVYVSAGSACSSHRKHGSVTLKAMGLSDSDADSTIRFSFCVHTTREELEYALSCLREIIPALRRFKRR